MFSTRMTALVALFCAGLTGPALAADLALVLTNRTYADGQEPGALRYDTLSRTLRQNGFQVFGGDNLTAGTMVDRTADFRDALAEQDVGRAVVVLSGRIVSDARQAWFLGRKTSRISDLDVGHTALPLDAVDHMLQGYPGQSLMVLAPAWRNRRAPGQGLSVGLGGYQPGQGVSVLSGSAAVEPVLTRLLQDDTPLAEAAQTLPDGVQLSGYLPRNTGFVDSAPKPIDNSDSAYWSAVRDINTAEGYQAYLRRFPNGLFVAEAQRLLSGATPDPVAEAEAEEKALNLTRDQRRAIQRDLTLLGFNTRGVDGVFGRGSRAAIQAYQRSRGFEDTGFVTRPMGQRLRRDADLRRAEVEAEDRAYWQSTGITGDEADLERYLDRYPDGVWSDLARSQLQAMETVRAQQAWQQAQAQDTAAAYSAFLDQYPDSPFARQAEARLNALKPKRASKTQIERDKSEEGLVAANPVARLLIEKALQSLGHNPGAADGRFDKQTRKAIRAFQRSADLPVSGFISQQTMASLTAASLR